MEDDQSTLRIIQAERWPQEFLPVAALMLFAHGATIQVQHQKMLVHLPKGAQQHETYPRRDGGPLYQVVFPDGFELIRQDNRQGFTYLAFRSQDLPQQSMELVERHPVFSEIDHVIQAHHALRFSSGSRTMPDILLPAQYYAGAANRTTVRVVAHLEHMTVTLLKQDITLFPLRSADGTPSWVLEKPDDRPHQFL